MNSPDRRHVQRLLVAFAAVAALLFVMALIVQAQDARPPSDRELAARLAPPGGAFHASVGNAPPSIEALKQAQQIALDGKDHNAATACAACHGMRGEGNANLGAPRLAGLPGWYLHKQLRDYTSGARKNAVMTPIAEAINDADAQILAFYYAVLDPPGFRTPPARQQERSALGAQLANQGNADKGVPACGNCHGPLGMGLSPSVPYLAGQNADYTVEQLKAWTDGTRSNDDSDVMHAIAGKLNEADMRAVAEYYQKLAR
jgi:cytochrome c553